MRLFVSTAILGAVAGMLAAAATPDRAIRALIDGGHWKQARAALEPRMKANPSDAEAASLLSRVRSAYGDLDGALALAESAVKVEPKNAEYRWQLAAIVGSLAQKAGVLKQIGLGRRFRQEAARAIALDPSFVDPRLGMISFYIQAPGIIGGDRKKAEQMAADIARIDPAQGYLARAQLLLETKAEGDFEALYRQAFEAASAPEVKWEAGARMLNLHLAAKTQKLDAAEEDARGLLQFDAHRAGPYIGLALVYAMRGKLAELDALLAEAEKAVPDDLGPFYQAGRVLLTTAGGDLSRADRYLRKYLTIEPEPGQPGPAAAHWRLGQVLEKQGRKAEAIAELEQAVRMNPDFENAKKDLKRLKS
jgi:tetratricopeptide (TPR) repeat protein